MKKQPQPTYKPLNIISDAIVTGDELAFNFNEYASALAEMIATKTNNTPFTMGISGKWGSGKTTLMKEIEKKLQNDLKDKDNDFRKIKTVWFDAWKYKEEDQILAALMQVIIQKIKEDSSFPEKAKKTLFKKAKSLLSRLDLLKMAGVATNVALGLNIEKLLTQKTEGEDKDKTTKIDVDITKAIINGDGSETEAYKEFLSFYDIFNKHFDDLLWSYLEVAKNKDEKAALVIFIDDLDRCPLPKIVQILETIKIFLDKKGCIFVIGAAKDIIQDALKIKAEYKGLKAERFLEKIIQIDFALPKKQVDNATVFIDKIKTKLAIGDELNENMLKIIMPLLDYNPRRILALFNHLKLQEAIMRHSNNKIGFKKMLYWRVLEIYKSDLFRYLIEEEINWTHFVEDIESYNKLKNKNDEEALKTAIKVDKNIPYIKDDKIRTLINTMGLSTEEYKTLVTYTQTFVEEIPEFKDDADFKKWLFKQEKKQEQSFRNQTQDYKAFIPIDAGTYNLENIGKKQIQAFKISKYPVTNAWFKEFLDDDGYDSAKPHWGEDAKKWLKEKKITQPKHIEDARFNKDYQPVVGVSWYEAKAFAKWLTIKTNKKYRLLTEQEWQAAASGKEPKTYPWGNKWDKRKCNNEELKINRTSVVGVFKDGITDQEVQDMSGNVWEWTSSKWSAKNSNAVIRGGSWYDDAENCRVTNRLNINPHSRSSLIGFRLALSS